MTANNPAYWRSGNYAQPIVANPPNGQRANNARHAVWHFSRPVTVEVYQAGHWRAEDGRYDRGAAQLVTMHVVAQPMSDHSQIREQLPEGESEESRIVVHLDSHQPENLTAAASNADLFPSGVFLSGVGQSAFYDTRGFGMIVVWRGQRWRVESVMVLDYGGDEEVAANSAIYRAVCTLHTDVQQEMRAVKSQEVIAP